ncbi:hypothetical protein BDV28DRAFT_158267 [Aspergillus coremiiformis]|uniref:Uncharacterized protein n=1 Tax=Aspergillus coremiiformis TaxID=138285 RepID=A0A5N6Z4W3_9EURO|nr:hypothetical protein BDV28DRAFT_158267 [Aspergillus coremiiformis]
MGSNNSKLIPTNKRNSENPACATTATMKLKQIADVHDEHEALPPYNAGDQARSLSIPQPRDWEELLLSSDQDRPVFNVKIPLQGAPTTNQPTNVSRLPLMKKYSLKEFELSQAYLFYWDKIEKANWFLEKITEADEDRPNQWDMVASLADKYGLVPHDICPDNFSAQNSAKMNWLVTVNLREHVDWRDKFLKEIYSLVTIMLGPPPSPQEAFHWEFHDVNVHKLGNVVEERPITYLNVDIQTIEAGAIAMLRAGHPVFFGCDVGQFYDPKLGVMDNWLLDLRLGFNTTLRMDKAERLNTGVSSMTHAMMLTGVHTKRDRPTRRQVQNSWGEVVGDKGWIVMEDECME